MFFIVISFLIWKVVIETFYPILTLLNESFHNTLHTGFINNVFVWDLPIYPRASLYQRVLSIQTSLCQYLALICLKIDRHTKKVLSHAKKVHIKPREENEYYSSYWWWTDWNLPATIQVHHNALTVRIWKYEDGSFGIRPYLGTSTPLPWAYKYENEQQNVTFVYNLK